MAVPAWQSLHGPAWPMAVPGGLVVAIASLDFEEVPRKVPRGRRERLRIVRKSSEAVLTPPVTREVKRKDEQTKRNLASYIGY